jgi:integrase
MSKRRRPVKAPRIYQKGANAAGQPYFYGDFRMWSDVGGKQEALKPTGGTRATTDPTEAQALFAARLLALQAARVAQATQPAEADDRAFPVRLGPAFALHLERRAASSKLAEGTLALYEKCAKTLLRILGNVLLASITPRVLTRYLDRRRNERNPKTGEGIAVRTMRNELHALSNLLDRAVSDEVIAKNPFKAWKDMPAVPLMEQSFLTRAQAQNLLAAAEIEDALVRAAREGTNPGTRTVAGKLVAPIGPRAHSYHAVILATFLYTGGRLEEVLGLAIGDVNLDRGVVMFQDTDFRKLKKARHRRAVPVPVALIKRLRRHIARLPNRDPRAALLPGTHGRPMGTIQKLLARCAGRAGLSELELSAHSLRHTFATVMMQTYVEVAKGEFAVRNNWEIARLLGHKNTNLVDEVYAHWVTQPEYERTLDFEPRSDKAASEKAASAPLHLLSRAQGVTAPSSDQIDGGENGMAKAPRGHQQSTRMTRRRPRTRVVPSEHVADPPRVAKRLA